MGMTKFGKPKHILAAIASLAITFEYNQTGADYVIKLAMIGVVALVVCKIPPALAALRRRVRSEYAN